MIVQELFSTLGLKVDRGSFAKGDKLLSAVKTGFAGLVAGIGLSQVAQLVKGVADVADSAVKASAKLGITVEAVQELGFAAKLSDIEQGELEGGLNRLAKGLDDVAQTGKGPAADALRRLGVSFSDLKGQALDENLGTIADAFAKMPNGAKKAALTNDLFGRNLGSKMIPLLNEGSAGLTELREEAQRLGIVVGDEAARKFEEFNDNQTRLSETWRGLKVQVVTALLPALTQLVDRLQGWITENRELISQGLSAIIQIAAVAFEALASAMDAAFKVITFFTEGSDEAMAVLVAIAAIIVSVVVPALLSMVAGWIAAAAPIIAVAVLIAAVTLAIIKLVKHWDKVKEAAGRAWDFIKEKARNTVDFILSIPGRILDAFVALGQGIVDAIVGAFDTLIEKAGDAAREIWAEIKDIPVIGQIASGAEAVADFGSDLFGSSGGGDFSTADIFSKAAAGGNLMTPGGGALSATFGDINIDVTAAPGMDEAALADMVGQKAKEAQQSSFNTAMDAVRGGRR